MCWFVMNLITNSQNLMNTPVYYQCLFINNLAASMSTQTISNNKVSLIYL